MVIQDTLDKGWWEFLKLWLETGVGGIFEKSLGTRLFNILFKEWTKSINSKISGCTVGGDGGCRVGEVRAGTTSPMPDHKGFKLQ